jgi:hypothetical protein
LGADECLTNWLAIKQLTRRLTGEFCRGLDNNGDYIKPYSFDDNTRMQFAERSGSEYSSSFVGLAHVTLAYYKRRKEYIVSQIPIRYHSEQQSI